MGTGSFAYKLLLYLHILSAIIGFGGVLLNGLYASRARKRPPAEALAVMEVNTFVSLRVAEIFIYLTGIFGLGLIGVSDDVWEYTDGWILWAIILYVVSLVVSLALLQPKVRQLVALQREMVHTMADGGVPAGPPPQAALLEKLGPQIGALSGVLHLSFAVILVLMVWKPGA